MMDGFRQGLRATLLLGVVACGDTEMEGAASELAQQAAVAANAAEQVPATLAPTTSCADLLERVQGDALAKLKMQLEAARQASDSKTAQPVTPPTPWPGGVAAPTRPSSAGASFDGETSPAPVGASDTNTQVAGIDEADFVKVVNDGRAIYLLHGSTLRRLKTWPPAETALEGKALLIEGSPSEMFVTNAGKAVVFSTVEGYGASPRTRGTPTLKVTVIDVSASDPKVLRELYYEGSYVSSRRYASEGADVVRFVTRASLKYNGAFLPSVQYYDPWGRRYDSKAIDAQLDEWETRTSAAIRATTLTDWLPSSYEVVGGKLVAAQPNCSAYYAPAPGLAEFGLTQVLSLDLARVSQPPASVTVVGGSTTIYSNAQHLVLVQPDYRYNRYGGPSRQRSALHVFALAGGRTNYAGSGWVNGQLPSRNPQFGIDVAGDGTLRLATTGWVRTPKQTANEPVRWTQKTENQVITARVVNGKVVPIGQSEPLGHENESVQSARFVGNRAYVVTYRQTDPLIVLDVADASRPRVLGEIEIPGFSEYMHPLDENHLITVGQSGDGGIQLQLFDVTTPSRIPTPKLLDFGKYTRSAASFEHKAFTFYDGVLAIPVSGTEYLGQRRAYRATLQLIRVDVKAGFTYLGGVDHARLFADNGAGILCGFCDEGGCFDYSCPYGAEVRRGHFVRGPEKTYVYSFSNAGVMVNDLTSLATEVARVGLPAPIESAGPWHDVSAANASSIQEAQDEEALPEVPVQPVQAPIPMRSSTPPAP